MWQSVPSSYLLLTDDLWQGELKAGLAQLVETKLLRQLPEVHNVGVLDTSSNPLKIKMKLLQKSKHHLLAETAELHEAEVVGQDHHVHGIVVVEVHLPSDHPGKGSRQTLGIAA